MQRIKATIQYIGTQYCGFQIQPNGISVQYVLQNALGKLLNQDIKVTASGRTDAGVHAMAQVVHFDIDGDFPPERLPYAIEPYLPNDISVLSAEKAAPDFHARYDCVLKTYEYYIVISKIKLPIYHNRAYLCEYDLDIESMRRAAEFITGKRDYRAFMASGSSVSDTIRDVKSLELQEIAKGLLRLRISADGFLYNMVRNITGTLIDVGRGRIRADDIEKIIESRDRKNAGFTAPACGLYLVSADYK